MTKETRKQFEEAIYDRRKMHVENKVMESIADFFTVVAMNPDIVGLVWKECDIYVYDAELNESSMEDFDHKNNGKAIISVLQKLKQFSSVEVRLALAHNGDALEKIGYGVSYNDSCIRVAFSPN